MNFALAGLPVGCGWLLLTGVLWLGPVPVGCSAPGHHDRRPGSYAAGRPHRHSLARREPGTWLPSDADLQAEAAQLPAHDLDWLASQRGTVSGETEVLVQASAKPALAGSMSQT
jgi:hypothetical protein